MPHELELQVRVPAREGPHALRPGLGSPKALQDREGPGATVSRKEPEGKSALLKNFAEQKMFAEDISEDFSEDRRYHFTGI